MPALLGEDVQERADAGGGAPLGRQGHGFATHRELWAPSAVPDPASRIVPHAMDARDIDELVACYRSAARRLRSAGFDGVEVYLAHGYLLAEFLSPFSNTRQDAYGGSLANRCRLPLRVIEAVQQVQGRGGERQLARHDLAYVSGTGGVMSEQGALILRGA